MKAVIFDVDGTLWDSTEKVAISWRMTCARRGVPCRQITGERLKQEFGKLLPDIGRSVFPELPEDAVLRLTEECCEEENRYLLADPPKTYEGIYELFRTLSGRMPVFIVSPPLPRRHRRGKGGEHLPDYRQIRSDGRRLCRGYRRRCQSLGKCRHSVCFCGLWLRPCGKCGRNDLQPAGASSADRKALPHRSGKPYFLNASGHSGVIAHLRAGHSP